MALGQERRAIRLEIGKKECAENTVFMGRRDQEYKNRRSISWQVFQDRVTAELDDMQAHLLSRANEFRDNASAVLHNKEDFYSFFAGDGGFALAHWNGSPEVEAKIKQDLNVTIRCVPFENKSGQGKCIFTGGPSPQRVIFAKAY